ncbi:SDR family oxidoreductase [Variovorax sp. J22G73]|uniref:SDR family NAD(P)-dependent oxidoreductase n=1 Tax=unclassified Variovorax TaxID=663243 RepID=UPI0025749E95|nr:MULTISPECIES: SDR family oxidoreductase [unclassified Variovorax]MDM0005018.1 SDR family oxidoreductase [Variovorax sp. J22R203]MDM0098434.1 SDR family oxidoreductase [Variovorax sp. J22G73]
MNNLKGKVAIVTGASKGIGAGIARALASSGAAVAVNYATDKAGAEGVVEAIRSAGGTAIAVQGDVAKAQDVQRLFAEIVKTLGTPNVLVNNAGVFQFEPIDAVTEETFHWQFNTNILGPVLLTQEALKAFPASGGSIVNIGTVISNNPFANASIYAATKAAMDAISISLSKELGARNIRVNTVAPGHTETEGTRRIGFVGSDAARQMVSQTPLGGRFGSPDDIAPTVVFLASDDAAWLTGERICASGGWR